MKAKGLWAIALGLIAGTSLSGAAMAADIVAPSTPEVFDWTGPYIGAHVGWGWVDLDGAFDSNDVGPGEHFAGGAAGDFTLYDDDILGGFQAGYNVQINQFVLGIEGDISFTDLNQQKSNADGEKVSFDTSLIASIRARAGVAMDNVLVYATGGGAWTDTKYKAKDDPGDTGTSGDKDLGDIGFVVGGGVEYAFSENWSVRAEGLYYEFDDKENTSHLTGDSDDGDFIKLKDIVVGRIGVDFRF